MSRRNKAVVELLLKNGAQPDLEDEGGHTRTLHFHARNTDVVELLNRESVTNKRGSYSFLGDWILSY